MGRRKSDIMWSDFGRRYLRDGVTLCWPERWQPGATAAEVDRALARPAHSKCDPAPKPKPKPEPPQMTYAAAGKLLGISAAGVFQRVRKHGWSAAMAMSGRQDRAAKADLL